MKRSKKVFIVVGILFILGVLIVGYDISRKTSFPGSKKHFNDAIPKSKEIKKDTTDVTADSVKNRENKEEK